MHRLHALSHRQLVSHRLTKWHAFGAKLKLHRLTLYLVVGAQLVPAWADEDAGMPAYTLTPLAMRLLDGGLQRLVVVCFSRSHQWASQVVLARARRPHPTRLAARHHRRRQSV